MQHARKVWIKNLWLAFVFISLIIIPQLSVATAASHLSQNEKVIVARDNQSGAVIYHSQKVYYYGLKTPDSAAIRSQGEINPQQIIVKYKSQTGNATSRSFVSIARALQSHGVKISQLNSGLRLALLKMNQPKNYFVTLHMLAKNQDVEYAEPDYIAHIQQAPNDPYYKQQWGLKDIHADLAWDKVEVEKRTAVPIAVLDTGINPDQEDLQDEILPGYNFIINNANTVDHNGHGTHIAGIAAALIDNGKGIAGVAGGSMIIPVKVLDDSGSGDYATIINGIYYAADHGAKVINMSLGGPGFSRSMQDAVNNAISRGVSIVAASGNDNGPVCFPGNYRGVIAVGAVDGANQRASFSNFGPKLDVMAPGVDIMSTYKGDASSYTMMSGTSMAAPFVAGVAALVRAANPGLTPAEVIRVIDRSATELGSGGFNEYYGWGLVDADKAVDIAINWTTGQPDLPAPTLAPNPTISTPKPASTETPSPTPPGFN